MAISNLISTEFDGKRDLSGIGGVETGGDAAEFLLLGANSVQARHFSTARLKTSKQQRDVLWCKVLRLERTNLSEGQNVTFSYIAHRILLAILSLIKAFLPFPFLSAF